MSIAPAPRRVSTQLALAIFFFPWVFTWFLLRQGHTTLSRVLGFSWLGFCLLAVMIVGDLANRRPPAHRHDPVPLGTTEAPGETVTEQPPIPEGVIIEMTEESFPKTYAAWGKDWMAKINGMQLGVAQLVSRAKDCSELQVVSLSEEMSEVRKHPVFVVDCAAEHRFFVTQQDLDSDSVPLSENAKLASIDEVEMIMACSDRVQRQMKYPDSYKQRAFRSGVDKHGYGRATVRIGFDAKNSFGGELPGRARCYVRGDRLEGPEIEG